MEPLAGVGESAYGVQLDVASMQPSPASLFGHGSQQSTPRSHGDDSPRAALRPHSSGPPRISYAPTRAMTVRAAQGRLSAIRLFLWKSILYGAFVWARRALNSRKWRFPARAVAGAARRRPLTVQPTRRICALCVWARVLRCVQSACAASPCVLVCRSLVCRASLCAAMGHRERRRSLRGAAARC